jgi:hypothetical protein
VGAAPTNASNQATTTTVIRYDPRWTTSLKTLRATYPDATTQAVTGLGSTFDVVVGTSYSPAHKPKISAAHNALGSHTAADGICG